MRYLLYWFLACATGAQAYVIPEIGANRAAIVGELGQPIGTIVLKEKELLHYPQGEITLENGIATRVEMVSEAQFAARQEKLEYERAQWAQRSAELAAQNKAEGEQIKAMKINSPAFAQLPARQQLAYWQNFQAQYPGVDVLAQISNAQDIYQAELAEIRKEQELVALKSRIAQAEKETAQAELEAQRLSNQINTRSQYGLRYYTTSAHRPSYTYCPPRTVTVYSNGHKQTYSTAKKQVPRSPHWFNYQDNGISLSGSTSAVQLLFNQR